MENKTSKYFKYAIGEIILVVIGILIALSINNWNEDRKKTISKQAYIETLVKDLTQDTIELKFSINEFETDLDELLKLHDRISDENATFDTLVRIARHEYRPYFNPYNSLNNNTFKALTSTGNIEILDTWLSDALLELNSYQLQATKIIDANIDIHMTILTNYNQKFNPLINENDAFGGKLFSKEGPLDDYLWDNTNPKELIAEFNGILTSKGTMAQIITWQRQTLLDRTTKLLDTINKVYKLND